MPIHSFFRITQLFFVNMKWFTALLIQACMSLGHVALVPRFNNTDFDNAMYNLNDLVLMFCAEAMSFQPNNPLTPLVFTTFTFQPLPDWNLMNSVYGSLNNFIVTFPYIDVQADENCDVLTLVGDNTQLLNNLYKNFPGTAAHNLVMACPNKDGTCRGSAGYFFGEIGVRLQDLFNKLSANLPQGCNGIGPVTSTVAEYATEVYDAMAKIVIAMPHYPGT